MTEFNFFISYNASVDAARFCRFSLFPFLSHTRARARANSLSLSLFLFLFPRAFDHEQLINGGAVIAAERDVEKFLIEFMMRTSYRERYTQCSCQGNIMLYRAENISGESIPASDATSARRQSHHKAISIFPRELSAKARSRLKFKSFRRARDRFKFAKFRGAGVQLFDDGSVRKAEGGGEVERVGDASG